MNDGHRARRGGSEVDERRLSRFRFRNRGGRAVIHALPFFLFCLGAWPLGAHEVISTKLTWSEHIARIFLKRCVSCHQEGGSAPMALATYEQARPWATAIKYAVLGRQMPPWQAVKGYGDFLNDLSLSQEEIALISSWAEGGAPQGDTAYLPPASDANGTVLSTVPEISEELPLQAETLLDREVVAVGIRPEDGALEARAYLPDGSIRELIWLRSFEDRWLRNYFFRSPISLPKGTRVRVFSDGGASAVLLLRR